jgi:integrase
MKKDQVDLENKVVWIPDSKTPNGVGEVPLTDLAVEAIRDQTQLAGNSLYLFPRENAAGHQTTFKTAWRLTLRRAKVPYFRIYDLRSTYATRLSAGGVADEWVTHSPAGRCERVQEVLASEAGGVAEAEPHCK